MTRSAQHTFTRAVWFWGVLDALSAALWSGPTAAFLSAFAVELGAGGAQLGLLLALNTLLANGLQLHGAQWTRRGRTSTRVYVSAAIARGSWLLAGIVPATLALGGRREAALLTFLAALVVSAVAMAAATPAMGARASTAVSDLGRTRYLADRLIATWMGALLGTAGMTALLTVRPGPSGYALGFALCAGIGLLGLGAYAALLRVAEPPARPHVAAHRAAYDPAAERLEDLPDAPATQEQATTTATTAGAPPSASKPEASSPVPQAPSGARFGVRVAASLAPGRRLARPAAGASGAGERPRLRWWPRVARRLGAPQHQALGEIVLAAAILQGGAAMVGPASPIWLVHYLGAPSSFLGVVSLASSLAAIASQRLWARWIDRSGPDRVLGAAGAAAALIPLGWMLVWQPWVALVVSAYGGLAWGGYSLAMTARLLQLAPAAERAAYLGTYAAAVGAAGAIGSLVAGSLTAAVPPVWIPAVFFLSFVTRGLGWLAIRPGRR